MLYVAGYLVSSALSLAYIVLVARMLGATYGIAAAMFGLFGLLGHVAGALQNAVAQAAVSARQNGATHAGLTSLVLYAALGCMTGTLLATPALESIGVSREGILISGLAACFMLTGSAGMGLLTAQGGLGRLGAIHALGACVRLLAGWICLASGLGIEGAITGYLAGYLAVTTATFLHPRGSTHSASAAGPSRRPAVDLLTMALFLIASAPFALDQLVVEFLAPAAGSRYAFAATSAKLLFFISAPVIVVAYTDLLASADRRAWLAVLRLASSRLTVLIVLVAGVIGLIPEQIVECLFPGRSHGIAYPLRMMTAGMALFCLASLFIHAAASLRSRHVLWAMLPPIPAGYALFASRHQTVDALAENLAMTFALQFLLATLALGWNLRSSRPGRKVE